MASRPDPHDPEVRPHPTLTDYYPDEPGRKRFVSWLFDETAHNYDWIIRVMSFGSGTWYRGDALRRVGLGPGMRVLDVACGTGPVAAAALRRVGPQGRVVAIDPSRGMLRETRMRVPVPLIQADAEHLPVLGDQFDVVSMGYALRHVADLDRTFREYLRVLRPEGRVLILEMTPPRSRLGRVLTRFYLGKVVPQIARIGTRSQDSHTLMRYFWDTIENCVPPDEILDVLRRVGFHKVQRKVFFGLFSEYSGTKAESTTK